MTTDPDSRDTAKSATKGKSAGGFFIAAGSIAGVLIGGIEGQPTFGLLVGMALGGLVALAIWLFDR